MNEIELVDRDINRYCDGCGEFICTEWYQPLVIEYGIIKIKIYDLCEKCIYKAEERIDKILTISALDDYSPCIHRVDEDCNKDDIYKT